MSVASVRGHSWTEQYPDHIGRRRKGEGAGICHPLHGILIKLRLCRVVYNPDKYTDSWVLHIEWL